MPTRPPRPGRCVVGSAPLPPGMAARNARFISPQRAGRPLMGNGFLPPRREGCPSPCIHEQKATPFARPLQRSGVTIVEVLMAFLILGCLLLPVFFALTNSVKETERFYTEAVAIAQAKYVMDTLMFQIPWRTIRSGNPARFDDPKNIGAVQTLLGAAIPRMFGSGCEGAAAQTWRGDGLLTDRKGFLYRIRLQCRDLDNLQFAVDIPGRGLRTLGSADLTPKDADGRYTLMKKLTLEIRWSLTKGRDPLKDPQARSLRLVAVKSHLDG